MPILQRIIHALGDTRIDDTPFKDSKQPISTEQLMAQAPGNFRNVEVQNERILRSAFLFEYEDPCHPRLDQLRDHYRLDHIVRGTHTEYEDAWCVANWLRTRFGYGDSDHPVDRNFNALDILQRGENGETFKCGAISGVFIQCLLSLGIQARLLNIESPQKQAHVITEVWCNDLRKWVLFDVDNNLSYTIQNKPASAYDLHKSWIESNWERVEIARGETQHIKVPDINEYRKVDFYWHFSVKMRNNWFSKRYPIWHPKGNAVLGDLEWVDSDTPPRQNRIWRTTNLENLYWSPNQTEMYLECYDPEHLRLDMSFTSSMPDGNGFMIHTHGVWSHTQIPRYTWNLQKGSNKFRVCATDAQNRSGIESRIVLEI